MGGAAERPRSAAALPGVPSSPHAGDSRTEAPFPWEVAALSAVQGPLADPRGSHPIPPPPSIQAGASCPLRAWGAGVFPAATSGPRLSGSRPPPQPRPRNVALGVSPCQGQGMGSVQALQGARLGGRGVRSLFSREVLGIMGILGGGGARPSPGPPSALLTWPCWGPAASSPLPCRPPSRGCR